MAPVGAPSVTEAARGGAEIYATLRNRLRAAGLSTTLGDEGGFAPELDTPEQACEHLGGAIEAAGYEPSRDGVALTLDPAASQFFNDGQYSVGGRWLSRTELLERYAELADRFPIWSLEDGMAEDDNLGWAQLTERLGDRVQIVGDEPRPWATHCATSTTPTTAISSPADMDRGSCSPTGSSWSRFLVERTQ